MGRDALPQGKQQQFGIFLAPRLGGLPGQRLPERPAPRRHVRILRVRPRDRRADRHPILVPYRLERLPEIGQGIHIVVGEGEQRLRLPRRVQLGRYIDILRVPAGRIGHLPGLPLPVRRQIEIAPVDPPVIPGLA